MKMTGVVPDDLLQRISTYECKLAWLIMIIAYIIKGEIQNLYPLNQQKYGLFPH